MYRNNVAVSVVIPALNEARNLPFVLPILPREIDEVVLVDGHSVDDTVAMARRLRPSVKIVKQNRTGKGNALACGFAAATSDIVVALDADGSTDPTEILRFCDALIDGADFAKGSRFLPGGGSEDLTRWRQWGNGGLNAVSNSMFRVRHTDLCYGFNALWNRHVPHLGLDATTHLAPGDTGLWGDGFEIETLMTLRAVKAGLRVVEVPSFERARLHGASNLHAVRDGIRVLRTLLRERIVDVETVPHAAPRYRAAAGPQQVRAPGSQSSGMVSDDPAVEIA